MTYYQVEVESVLYGTLAENETAIRIWQPWWISMDGSQIETFSDLKPLQVGNRRIFALSYSETNGTYAISCDSDGCMPIPTADLLNGSLSDPEVLKVMEEEYNLYDGEDIRYGYYRDVLLRYRDQIRIPSSTLKTNSRDHRTHMVSYKDVVFYISKDGKIDVVDSNERKWLPNIDFTAIDLEIFLETLFITDSKGDVHLYQLSEGTIGSEITLEDLKSEESPDLSLGVTDMLHARKNLLNLTNVQDVSVLRTDASTYFVITESENGTQAICIIGDDVYTANPEPSHGKPVAISGGAVLYEDGSVHSPWKGLLPTGTIEDYDYSSWDNVIDICFDGVFGIREDGTVLVRDNKYATVRKWNNISSVTVRPNPDSINDVYALTNDGYLMNNHLYRNNLDFLVDNKINVSDLIVIDHRLIGLNENSEPVIIELPEQ